MEEAAAQKIGRWMERDETTLSFDVFDTALTRVWFKPVDVFLAVGRELVEEGHFTDAQSWARARERVEHDLRQALNQKRAGADEEVGLPAIHDALATRLGMRPSIRDRALAIELDLERISMRPIAQTRNAIAAAKAVGRPVVFLSDTYFDHSFVAEILQRAGVTLEPEALYTSLALGRTKRTGSLFSHVLAQRGLKPEALLHVGDNLHSDVKSARKIGVGSRLFVAQRPTRYEKLLYRPRASAPRLLRAAVAGAARAARLGVHYEDSYQQVVAETSANIAGPLLTGFTLWVLAEAMRRGLRRLYFLSRDGQILLKIAMRLNAWFGFGLDLRYLYGSRQSLFLPSVTELDESTLDWLTEKAESVSLRTILSRVEIDPLEEAQSLAKAGFPAETWDRKLGSEGARSLHALLQCADFQSCLLARARDYRSVLLDYLKTEGIFDGVPLALIDIGWKGRLQLCLGKVLRTLPSVNQAPLIGFYYGLNRRPDPAIAGELYTYVDTNLPNSALLETFVRADHGSVRRFRRLPTGETEAELLSAEDGEAIKWGLRAQQAGIVDFLDSMIAVLKPGDADLNLLIAFLRESSLSAFDAFSRLPTASEAAAYGTIRHAIDQTHHDPVDMAPLLKSWQISLLLFRTRAEIDRHVIWLEGTIARSGRMAAPLFAALEGRRYALATASKLRSLVRAQLQDKF